MNLCDISEMSAGTASDEKTPQKTSLSTCNSEKNSPGDRKRTDYLEWAEYFMAVSFLSAMRSKDPATQVGACIVNEEKQIVGIGYNGMPRGCSDDELPWGKSQENE